MLTRFPPVVCHHGCRFIAPSVAVSPAAASPARLRKEVACIVRPRENVLIRRRRAVHSPTLPSCQHPSPFSLFCSRKMCRPTTKELGLSRVYVRGPPQHTTALGEHPYPQEPPSGLRARRQALLSTKLVHSVLPHHVSSSKQPSLTTGSETMVQTSAATTPERHGAAATACLVSSSL